MESLRLVSWNRWGWDHGIIGSLSPTVAHHSQGHHWPQVSPGAISPWLCNSSREFHLAHSIKELLPHFQPRANLNQKQTSTQVVKWELFSSKQQPGWGIPPQAFPAPCSSPELPCTEVLGDGTNPELRGAFPTSSSQDQLWAWWKHKNHFYFAFCAAEPALSPNTNTQEKKDSGKTFSSPVEIILVWGLITVNRHQSITPLHRTPCN